MFTTPRIESVFISFVSFSFNNPHVSVPTRTSIRESKIRVPNKFVLFELFVFKKHVSAPPRPKIREIGEIRVQKKYSCHSLIRVQNNLCSKSAK